jgi:hypothetical protein
MSLAILTKFLLKKLAIFLQNIIFIIASAQLPLKRML